MVRGNGNDHGDVPKSFSRECHGKLPVLLYDARTLGRQRNAVRQDRDLILKAVRAVFDASFPNLPPLPPSC